MKSCGTRMLLGLASLRSSKASWHFHRAFDCMALLPVSYSNNNSIHSGLVKAKRSICLKGSPLQRFTTGLFQQRNVGICRLPGWGGIYSRDPKHLASETFSSATSPSCEGDGAQSAQQQNSSSKCSSDQTLLSFAKGRTQSVECRSLSKLSISPGQVHVWWLFPDDVRPTPSNAPKIAVVTSKCSSFFSVSWCILPWCVCEVFT